MKFKKLLITALVILSAFFTSQAMCQIPREIIDEMTPNSPNLNFIKTTFTPVKTWEAENYGYQTGKIIKDTEASNGKAISSTLEEHSSGTMLFGQYEDLPAGNYIAFFRLKSGNPITNNYIARLDATCNYANTEITSVTISKNEFNGESYTVIPLIFTLDNMNNKGVEVRILWTNNTASLTVDKIDLFAINGEIPVNIKSILKKAPQVQATGFPNNLDYKKTTFPTKDIFPVSNKVSQNLTVVDARMLNRDWRLALTTLQGLVNRDTPKLYLIFNDESFTWLNNMKSKGYIKSYKIEKNPKTVFKTFKKYYTGAVTIDIMFPTTINIATMYGSVYDMIACSDKLAKELGLDVKFSTKGKWKTNSEAYNWAFDNLWDKQNHYLASCLWYDSFESRDYLVQHKAFIFWVPGPIDSANSYSDPLEEMKFVEKLLAALPPNTPLMGYSWAGEDVGIGEGGGVGLFAEFGHYLVGSVGISNVSVHSGIKTPEFKQKTKSTYPKLDKNKKYVAFTMSDGDNLPVMTVFNWPQYWTSDARGKTPITWTISPSSCILVPDIMEYYYSTATENDTFSVAVSGVGYTYPALYGLRFKKDQVTSVFDGFIEQTAEYMKKMDLNVLMPMNVTKKEIALFADKIEFLKGAFPDYSRNLSAYSDTIYLSNKNVPVIHSGTTWDPNNTEPNYMAKRMADEIRDFPPNNGEPVFIHAFLWNWGYSPAIVNDIAQQLGSDYVFVSAEELAYLAKQYMEEQKTYITAPTGIGIVGSDQISFDVTLQNYTENPSQVEIKVISGLKSIEISNSNPILTPGEPTEINISGEVIEKNIKIEYITEYDTKNTITEVSILESDSIPEQYKNKKLTFIGKYEGEGLKVANGATIEDINASGTKIRAAIYGESNSGTVCFGPYANIDTGDYVALFVMKRMDDKGEDGKCTLEIAPAGKEYIVFEDLTKLNMPVEKVTNIAMPFNFRTGQFEIRFQWDNYSSIGLDCFYLFRVES